MNSEFHICIEYANNEFNGTLYHKHAYNGLSLIAMLQRLSVDDIVNNCTYEGYSIIEIIMHLAYCKYLLVIRFNNTEIEEYPYYKGIEGFFTPSNLNQDSYYGIIEYLIYVHEKAMDSIDKLRKEEYEKRIDDWNMSYKEAAIWICNHDTYHIAQIRNMGIQVLKRKKVSMDVVDIGNKQRERHEKER